MLNRFMKEKELNVKPGDRVMVRYGDRGTVLSVHHGCNGDEEYTNVQVHFDEDTDLAHWGQYQDGCYSDYTVI